MRQDSFAPSELGFYSASSHGLRRGLHSSAASRLERGATELRRAYDMWGCERDWIERILCREFHFGTGGPQVLPRQEAPYSVSPYVRSEVDVLIDLLLDG